MKFCERLLVYETDYVTLSDSEFNFLRFCATVFWIRSVSDNDLRIDESLDSISALSSITKVLSSVSWF